MEKRLRRVVSVVAALAVVMLMAVPFGVAPTARADEGSFSQITTKDSSGNQTGTSGEALANSDKGGQGNIVIHLPSSGKTGTTYNYKVYKVFDATVSNASSTGGHAISYNAYHTVNGNTDVPTITGDGNIFVRDDAGNVYYGKVSNSSTEDSIQIVVGGQYKVPYPQDRKSRVHGSRGS